MNGPPVAKADVGPVDINAAGSDLHYVVSGRGCGDGCMFDTAVDRTRITT